MAPATARRLRELPKGDALAAAQIAGIMAAKRTSELIPLCHPLPLTHVDVVLSVEEASVEITASAETTAQTGVEMEALVARHRRGADGLRHGEGGRRRRWSWPRCGSSRRRRRRVKAAVLTVSDGVDMGTREDASGDLLEELLRGEGYEVVRRVVPDERDAIAEAIEELAVEARLVLTTGGTGLGPRDVTPEATMTVLERLGARDRRGDPRRLDREDAARAALPWRRRCARPDARRQPARLDRRLPRRVRRPPAGARARASAAGGRGDRPPPDVIAAEYPRRFASLVKIEHTVFALPFAYVGAFLAVDGVPSAHDLLWITVAMVGARSLAMGLNRLIDAGIDARNPRTATRELPAGRLTAWQVVVFCAASLAVFLLAVYQLDPIVRWLWPIPVAGFVIYPYLKRFTWLSHLWLGAVDGLAPVGAWVAITGELPWQAWALGGAVACWVAGFDHFYSLLDVDVDRREGLHSVATRFGRRRRVLGRAAAPCPDRCAPRRCGPRPRGRRLLLARRRRRRGAPRLRALARPPGRPAPPGHRVLHDERRHQRGVLRLRPADSL